MGNEIKIIDLVCRFNKLPVDKQTELLFALCSSMAVGLNPTMKETISEQLKNEGV